MKEHLFIEVVKVKNGEFINPQPHIDRISHTTHHFFSNRLTVQLNRNMIPYNLQSNILVKCRIVYGREIVSIDFEPYKMRSIKSLLLIKHNTIDYTYKYLNRDLINKLQASNNDCDDILIVKNSQITDTSFSNVVFEDHSNNLFTPSSTLLAGTKRQQLLNSGIIHEKDIHVNDIYSYVGVYIINAMIDLEDKVFVEIDSII